MRASISSRAPVQTRRIRLNPPFLAISRSTAATAAPTTRPPRSRLTTTGLRECQQRGHHRRPSRSVHPSSARALRCFLRLFHRSTTSASSVHVNTTDSTMRSHVHHDPWTSTKDSTVLGTIAARNVSQNTVTKRSDRSWALRSVICAPTSPAYLPMGLRQLTASPMSSENRLVSLFVSTDFLM
jgi:hypothetical protein